MKRIILLLTLFFIALTAYAQKQASIWYFGEHSGLNFTNNGIEILSNSKIGTSGNIEGSSIISDKNGNLLMYSDGTRIWNRKNEIMPNGDSLMGDISSTQNSIIIPQPGSDRFFYVFTSDGMQNKLKNGLRYSVVDMCADNEYGDVIDTIKNILVTTPIAEKICVIQHYNGTDYWIVVHPFLSGDFYSYLLTNKGLSGPIISTIGTYYPVDTVDTTQWSGYITSIGQMKASPNGEWIAMCSGNSSSPISEVYKFNNSSGLLYDMIDIEIEQPLYSVEFSPNNNILYFSSYINTNKIYQVNLSYYPDKVKVKNSLQSLQYINSDLRGMQLGIDNKIYILSSSTFLSVIQSPNEVGYNCNIDTNRINFNGKASFALPSFIAGFKYNNGLVNCVPDTITNPNDTTFGGSGDTILFIETVNAFTPNGDGLNDKFSIVTNKEIYNFTMVIYNRWGEKLFESNDVNQGWDGTYKGVNVIQSVYLYIIKYQESPDGEQITKQGTLHLIR